MRPLDDIIFCRCARGVYPYVDDSKTGIERAKSLLILCELCELKTDYCKCNPIVVNETIDK